LVVLLVGLVPGAMAEEPALLMNGETIELRHMVELPPIQPFEITGQKMASGELAISEGRWGRGRSPNAANNAPSMVIERTIDPLWTIWVPEDFDLRDLEARYEVEGRDGRLGNVSHLKGLGSHVRVTVVSLSPEVVARNNGWVQVVGSVRLRFHLGTARYAGEYGGEVVVSLSGG
jgi:hypothetical protein